ncbi:MAG: hypothetical protein IT438_04770 [Phycisphaerales bacterium]|nr:hypothetical protein [Phycisphaerales bacterium]
MHWIAKTFIAIALAFTISLPAIADDCSTGCPTGTSGDVKLFRSISAGAPSIVGCAAAGTNISFDISAWSGDNILIISHCGSTLGDIGRLTITGNSSTLTSLFVAVVGASEDPALLSSNLEQLDRACVNFGGLLVTDPDTLAKTRASIAVTGDVEHRGADPDALDIEVNQVVRIQADNAINANIRAAATGTLVASENNSIGQVRAGHAIRGNIVAAGGDIFTVRVLNVAPLAAAEGIRGDIIAEAGSISSIFTTGPIGTETAPTAIKAFGEIRQIRTSEDATNAVPLPGVSVFADIRAGTEFDAPGEFPNSDAEGALGLVEVGGDLVGTVQAGSLVPLTLDQFQHAGILVRGDILAPIEIATNARNADIIGRSVPEPVMVGCQMKGSVVAFGTPTTENPDHGRIAFVSIGYGDAFGPLLELGSPRGLIGVDCWPIDLWLTDAELQATPCRNPWFTPNSVDGRLTACTDGGAIDGTIFAHRIDTVEVFRMSQFHVPTHLKAFKPRIEARSVGTMIIGAEGEKGALESGAVWSGDVQYDSTGEVITPVEDFYAQVGEIKIHACVGATADMWIKDCVLTSIGDLYGELHLPALEQGERINIMRSFGDISAECGCLAATGGEFTAPCEPSRLDSPTNPAESTPRAQRVAADEPADGAAPVARISVFTPEGLRGQVVINSQNTGLGWSELCKGIVTIGDEENLQAPDITLSKALAQPNQLPYYQRTSADLGGGAVGLAPFHLHEIDCEPDHKDNEEVGPGDGIFEPGIPTDKVLARFYGPVVRGSGYFSWQQAFDVQCRPLSNPGFLCNWFTVTSSFTFTGPTATSAGIGSRTIVLSLTTGSHPGPGIYRLVPKVNAESGIINSVLSRNVTGTPPTALPTSCGGLTSEDEFTSYRSYIFRIKPDCDADSVDDETETPYPSCDSCEITDFNESDGKTVQDIFDFLTVYFLGDCVGPALPHCTATLPAACPGDADVNNSCGVSVQDIFDFLAAYFGCSM